MICAELFEDRNLLDSQTNEVAGRLIRLVREVLGTEAALPEPFPTDRQFSDLGVTSLKMVNLMLAVEIEFDIALPQADITPDNFRSLESVQALVVKTLR